MLLTADEAGEWPLHCKFAPYVAVVYDRDLGGKARLTRADGEDVGGWQARAGVRAWF